MGRVARELEELEEAKREAVKAGESRRQRGERERREAKVRRYMDFRKRVEKRVAMEKKRGPLLPEATATTAFESAYAMAHQERIKFLRRQCLQRNDPVPRYLGEWAVLEQAFSHVYVVDVKEHFDELAEVAGRAILWEPINGETGVGVHYVYPKGSKGLKVVKWTDENGKEYTKRVYKPTKSRMNEAETAEDSEGE
ncbi:hypothetical protein BDY21DRAFT_339751 [Lineolata rhizophorae]|uniref:Uncharacterized protein n=1 Tax=Lineolata rhizophorae TaxID=578093 RepID=A0A6A6P4Z3_9PEZI|nr:hypothetical protein BDY21DRAFT_339751 [Lineolata rhizophorae]